jgi:predicted nucleic acid-binding protein
MILADTSVWIDHFRYGTNGLAALLLDDRIAMHPLVTAELALGSLKRRAEVLDYLDALPQISEASRSEIRFLVETQKLWGLGLGWVDVSLLASARLAGCRFWTMDKRLAQAARRLDLA